VFTGNRQVFVGCMMNNKFSFLYEYFECVFDNVQDNWLNIYQQNFSHKLESLDESNIRMKSFNQHQYNKLTLFTSFELINVFLYFW